MQRKGGSAERAAGAGLPPAAQRLSGLRRLAMTTGARLRGEEAGAPGVAKLERGPGLGPDVRPKE
jgi:hypothetical protein